jgi:hypothetical protein
MHAYSFGRLLLLYVCPYFYYSVLLHPCPTFEFNLIDVNDCIKSQINQTLPSTTTYASLLIHEINEWMNWWIHSCRRKATRTRGSQSRRRQVLTLLALLVQQHKCWRSCAADLIKIDRIMNPPTASPPGGPQRLYRDTYIWIARHQFQCQTSWRVTVAELPRQPWIFFSFLLFHKKKFLSKTTDTDPNSGAHTQKKYVCGFNLPHSYTHLCTQICIDSYVSMRLVSSEIANIQ